MTEFFSNFRALCESLHDFSCIVEITIATATPTMLWFRLMNKPSWGWFVSLDFDLGVVPTYLLPCLRWVVSWAADVYLVCFHLMASWGSAVHLSGWLSQEAASQIVWCIHRLWEGDERPKQWDDCTLDSDHCFIGIAVIVSVSWGVSVESPSHWVFIPTAAGQPIARTLRQGPHTPNPSLPTQGKTMDSRGWGDPHYPSWGRLAGVPRLTACSAYAGCGVWSLVLLVVGCGRINSLLRSSSPDSRGKGSNKVWAASHWTHHHAPPVFWLGKPVLCPGCGSLVFRSG